MVQVASLFNQLLHHFPRLEFAALVKKHRAERAAKGFDCWTQFVAMLFCQLGHADSLREICNGLACCLGKLVHLGIAKAPNQSTLSYANEHRPAALYQELFIRPGALPRTGGGKLRHSRQAPNRASSLRATTRADSSGALRRPISLINPDFTCRSHYPAGTGATECRRRRPSQADCFYANGGIYQFRSIIMRAWRAGLSAAAAVPRTLIDQALQEPGMELASVTLDDKYALAIRPDLPLRHPGAGAAADDAAGSATARRGLNTGGFISGYRGSPLGGYDTALWQARAHLLKRTTSISSPASTRTSRRPRSGAASRSALFPGAKVDGVFGIWYGKGPGVDRSMDVFKHANAAGTSRARRRARDRRRRSRLPVLDHWRIRASRSSPRR